MIRSRRKSISLEISRQGRILVRAPLSMRDAEIARFVSGKEEWIRTHLEKVRQIRDQASGPGRAVTEVVAEDEGGLLAGVHGLETVGEAVHHAVAAELDALGFFGPVDHDGRVGLGRAVDVVELGGVRHGGVEHLAVGDAPSGVIDVPAETPAARAPDDSDAFRKIPS